MRSTFHRLAQHGIKTVLVHHLVGLVIHRHENELLLQVRGVLANRKAQIHRDRCPAPLLSGTGCACGPAHDHEPPISSNPHEVILAQWQNGIVWY
eukprot:CAMPEP_0117596870 /NCGR_PEP_ID=MMETSP0784-20121206/74549_1 /TAXON_ID=39447 /ORGANISM="" /LENGTH=94 /DNA_ID=CAMNT_0005399193 /DNA_START=72 /DNA_END=353 /DNA_ORIENTATION=+